jgi:hypothetical protein
MNCPNCEALLTSKYCGNCGQKADTHKITLSHILHDFQHALTHTDKGFLLLIKKLILRPGHVAKEYLAGKRKLYFNPLSFLVITSALHALVTSSSGYFEAMSFGSGNSGGRQMPEWMIDVFRISEHNGKTLSLIVIAPINALLTWLMFRKPKFNYAEHFVLHSFLIGQGHIIRMVIFVPFFLIAPEYVRINLYVFQALLLIYQIVAYKQFFDQNIVWTSVKGILIMILSIVLYWVLIIAFVLLRNLILH